ncbi:MAG: ATP-binding protein [Rhizobiaceae bacterium]|nr:ATP-binding protein [Rhizobiaceae bacterium]
MFNKRKAIQIRAVDQVRKAASMACTIGYPVRVVGDAGIGKTTALRMVAAEIEAAHCEVTQHTKLLTGMYRMVLNAYGIHTESHFIDVLARQLRNRLDTTTRTVPPLFVGEYQTFSATVLRELLHFQEQSGFPLLLVGNSERLAQSTAKDANALEQIYSRIGATFKIEKPTDADFRSIAVEYNVEGKEAYSAIANYGLRTSLRAACHLLETCVIATTQGVGSIRLSHIETTLMGMRSSRDALKLLSPVT